MACRQVNYANRRKAELILAMGSVCWACGSSGPLHVDHPNGRDYQPRKLSFSARVARYWREWTAGEIRLLCEQDNDSNRYNGVPLSPPPGVVIGQPEPSSEPF
jgi:hypothetical protein